MNDDEDERLTVRDLIAVLSKLNQDWKVQSNNLTGDICLYRNGCRDDLYCGNVDIDTGEIRIESER